MPSSKANLSLFATIKPCFPAGKSSWFKNDKSIGEALVGRIFLCQVAGSATAYFVSIGAVKETAWLVLTVMVVLTKPLAMPSKNIARIWLLLFRSKYKSASAGAKDTSIICPDGVSHIQPVLSSNRIGSATTPEKVGDSRLRLNSTPIPMASGISCFLSHSYVQVTSWFDTCVEPLKSTSSPSIRALNAAPV